MDYNGSPVDGLLDATVSRNITQVEILIQSGVDPCTPTIDGTTPIHKAAVMEHPAGSTIVSTMLHYGADPNVKTHNGLSPLHIAAMWGRVDTIDVLLDNGADVTLKDHDDMSPLDYAEEADECRVESIDALTRYRAGREENDSGCETFGNCYINKGNERMGNYYVNRQNGYNGNYMDRGRDINGNYDMDRGRDINGNYYINKENEIHGNYYHWYNQYAMPPANYYMYNGYPNNQYYYYNQGNMYNNGNNPLDRGNEINGNYYLGKENEKSEDHCLGKSEQEVCSSNDGKVDEPAVKENELDNNPTFTDISDVSDSDGNDASSDESRSESFWSVSSVPYSKSSTMLRSVIRKLDEELSIEEKVSSTSALLNHDEVIIIVCGIQESYRWKINSFHKLTDVSQRLLSAVHLLDIPVLITEDPTYDYGPTVREIDISQSWVFQKSLFSGVNEELKNYLINMKSSRKISDIILFGLEAHICVQLTALDLISEGYNVHIVRDATFSRLHDDRMFAFERIRQSGGFITTFESILCMLLKDHKHSKYDQLKELISDFTVVKN